MLSTKHNNDLIALIDCNNFYVSCEKVFNPKFNNRPVVVLSNNDGCIVARSKEVKDLGVPMGAPAFEWADVFRKNGVVVLSSNYSLYGDMSARVMSTLSQFSSDIQIYSIDEAFLMIPAEGAKDLAAKIRGTILQWIGLPVSVGVSTTKTLSKVANRLAKKDSASPGYCVLDDPASIEAGLKKMPVEDVWGIGRKTAEFLYRYGIRTAWEYAQCDDEWIKKHLKVIGLRMAWELRGFSCLDLEDEPTSKQSITSSRSFRAPITKWDDMSESVSTYVATAAEELRSQGSLASYLEVYITTSPFRKEEVYARATHIVLPEPTNYTPTLITYAKIALERIFRKGLHYKKAGVILCGLVPENRYQPDLFIRHKPELVKQKAVSELVDRLNRQYGYDILKYAAEGVEQSWRMKRDRCTPRFTTNWSELLTIKI